MAPANSWRLGRSRRSPHNYPHELAFLRTSSHFSERDFIFPIGHHHQRPTLHPVGFFVPTLACLRGFMRIIADFEVSRNPANSLTFSLFAPLFSPSLGCHASVKSTSLYFFNDKNQKITRRLIKRLICSIGRRWKQHLGGENKKNMKNYASLAFCASIMRARITSRSFSSRSSKIRSIRPSTVTRTTK